jgi:hypothetical protein
VQGVSCVWFIHVVVRVGLWTFNPTSMIKRNLTRQLARDGLLPLDAKKYPDAG